MANDKVILPPQTIGIIGGGQLGRMMAIAARYMGYQLVVLDPTPHCPAAQVADHQIIAHYDDIVAIQELIERSDVITYEFENVDLEAARLIEKEGKLPQGSKALEITQHRANEKQLMKEVGVNVPSFEIVSSKDECEKALKSITLPAVIKTCQGGYDGKGQFKINSEADFAEAIDFVTEGSYIIEQWVTFDKEISTVFTRNEQGKITFFPIAENDHHDHILYETIAPAEISDDIAHKARKASKQLAEEIDVVGTFAIEMFVRGDDIYINEMAPRPHNSGHFTIESCNISQFEQHIRAICGLPLIDIKQIYPARMINVLGEDMPAAMTELSEGKTGFVHLYGKAEAKEKRKMGHITFVADTKEKVAEYALQYKKQ